MNRVYVFVPLIAGAAFLAYYADRKADAALQLLPHETVGDRYFGRDGVKEARAALARGRLVYLDYGLAVPWSAESREIAQQRFGIDTRVIAGCVITKSLEKFVADYNSVMEAAISTRFGSDAFDVINREGQALLELRWRKNPANKAPEPTPGPVTPRATGGVSR